jgi:hypothetical protein
MIKQSNLEAWTAVSGQIKGWRLEIAGRLDSCRFVLQSRLGVTFDRDQSWERV